MRVATHRGQVGVAEVLGNEARVACCLAEPCCSGVAQRMGGYAFLEPGPLGGSLDNGGEDLRLQSPAGETAEDGSARRALSFTAEPPQLDSELGREWLAAWLAAL